jgi:hypothetical protein
MKRLSALLLLAASLCVAPIAFAFVHKVYHPWRDNGFRCVNGVMICQYIRTVQIVTWEKGLPRFTYVTEEKQEPCGTCAPTGGRIGR